jgi:hypothetical protein
MYLGMKRLGRETQLVVYPDEYHGQKTFISKRPYGRYLDWLKNMQMSLIPVKLKMTKALLIIDIQNDYFENGKWNLLDLKSSSKTILEFLEIKIQVSSIYT